jgi:hypothetical protein
MVGTDCPWVTPINSAKTTGNKANREMALIGGRFPLSICNPDRSRGDSFGGFMGTIQNSSRWVETIRFMTHGHAPVAFLSNADTRDL